MVDVVGLAPQIALSGKLFTPREMAGLVAGFLLHMNRPVFALAALGVNVGLMLLAMAVLGFEPKKKSIPWG